MRIGLYALLAILVVSVQPTRCETIRRAPERFLPFDDLVFIGSLVHSEWVQTNEKEWGFGGSDPFTMASLTFEIEERLRGKWAGDQITIFSNDIGLVELISGRVVVSAYYAPRVMGGKYVIRDHDEVLLADDDNSWTFLSGEKSLTTQQIRDLVADVAPAKLATRSDLVAEGRIVAINDTASAMISGEVKPVAKVWFDIDRTLAGTSDSLSITFVLPRELRPEPPWAYRYPFHVGVGQHWIVFLTRSSFGWYPAAGSNGMFRVHEGDVIYDNRVHGWYKADQLERTIRRAVGGE